MGGDSLTLSFPHDSPFGAICEAIGSGRMAFGLDMSLIILEYELSFTTSNRTAGGHGQRGRVAMKLGDGVCARRDLLECTKSVEDIIDSTCTPASDVATTDHTPPPTSIMTSIFLPGASTPTTILFPAPTAATSRTSESSYPPWSSVGPSSKTPPLSTWAARDPAPMNTTSESPTWSSVSGPRYTATSDPQHSPPPSNATEVPPVLEGLPDLSLAVYTLLLWGYLCFVILRAQLRVLEKLREWVYCAGEEHGMGSMTKGVVGGFVEFGGMMGLLVTLGMGLWVGGEVWERM